MTAVIREMAAEGRRAARQLAATSGARRNAALESIARALGAQKERILAANQADLKAAEEMVARGELASPLVKRLNLQGSKFSDVVAMVRSVEAQPDPLGCTQSAMELHRGLELFRISVPIGVIGVIFESRPDALVQIACLCLKSGNAVLLKGGREAGRSNRVLAQVIAAAAQEVEGIPSGWIGLLETRDQVGAMLELDRDIDLIIPRGSNEFVQYIMRNTRIAVMGHADGVCHVYVDSDADVDQAARIVVDSKTQYAAVCNAVETLLVHREIAPSFLPVAVRELRALGVELRGDAATLRLARADGEIEPAAEEDWGLEYLDYILAVKVVESLEEAIEHINRYGSGHTDAIVSEDGEAARKFLRKVDSASVLHNASTRFADGFRYGLGAEVGISTNRLHSRGPVGLEGLTIYKFILEGDGHVVGDFEGEGQQSYTHRRLHMSWQG